MFLSPRSRAQPAATPRVPSETPARSPRASQRRAALLAAAPEEARSAARALLRKAKGAHKSQSLALAACAWPHLAPADRAALMERAGADCGRLVDSLSADAATVCRMAVVDILGARPASVSPAPLLALIADHDAAVRAAASAMLLRLADALTPADPAWLGFDAALAHAANAFDRHRNRVAIDAVARLADRPGPAVKAWLRDDSQPGHLALRALLRRDRAAGSRSRAAGLLALPSFTAAALDRLLQPDTPEEHERCLSGWPALALRPRAAAALAKVAPAQAGALLPHSAEVARFVEDARIGHARLAAIIRLPPEARVAALAPRLADPAPRVRAAAVHALSGSPLSAPVRGLLMDFAFDPDDAVAASAAAALAAEPNSAVRALARSRHPRVRDLGATTANAADALANPVAARAQFERQPEAVIRCFRAGIESGSPAAQLAAMRAALRLGLGDAVEIELLGAAATRADMRVPATAASSLSAATHATARQAAERLATHPDARVRANAVEALARLAPGSPVIESKAADGHARTRANAIVAMLRGEQSRAAGVIELSRMLADPRPGHRLSALWAAERGGAIEAAADIARLASGDDDEAVCERSLRCARVLLARMA